MKSRPARRSLGEGGEKTKEQLKEDLRKTRAELAVQKWGIEKTLGGMKVVVKELIQRGKEAEIYKLAVDNISNQIIITDPDATVLYINNATEKITGYTAEEAVGGKAGKLWGNLMERSFYENLWKTIKIDKKTFAGEMINKRKNNQTYTALISISPILDEKGEVEFFVGIERDITKEKEVDRMKTEFISLTSHQLRTPLSAIKWYLEMLLNGDVGKLTDEQTEYVKIVDTSNERMIGLVNVLLNVSRIESGRIIIDPKPTNLHDLVKGILDELQEKFQEKKIEPVISINGNLPVINLDQQLVRQVYINLLTNAIKYTPSAGEIHLFISKKDDMVISQISDTGYGIPAKDKDMVFTKFYRGENIVKQVTDGNGLGLYLVKAIVESSGGKIWFDSIEDKSTSFYFTLPLSGMRQKTGEVKLS